MEPLFFNRARPLSICLWIPHCPSRPPYWHPERSQRTQEASNLPNPELFLLRWRLCTQDCKFGAQRCSEHRHRAKPGLDAIISIPFLYGAQGCWEIQSSQPEKLTQTWALVDGGNTHTHKHTQAHLPAHTRTEAISRGQSQEEGEEQATVSFNFWPHCTACGILVPWPWIEPAHLALKAQNLNHRTSGDVPWEGSSV